MDNKNRAAGAIYAFSLYVNYFLSEEQLESLLAESWRVVTTLPSGKIVLER